LKDILSEVREQLLAEIPKIDGLRVETVRLGLGYSGLKLDTGHAGVCNSMLSEAALDCCEVLLKAGTLAESPVTEFLSFIESWDFIERIMAVSALNALSQMVFEENPDRYLVLRKNLVDVMEVQQADTVVMVGHIKPFNPVFKAKAKTLYILERSPNKDEGTLPDTACEKLLPEADVVVITGSALSNGTLDRLLELASNARTVAIVGPTASCLPDPLFSRGVDYVGGIRIHDADKAMQILSEGGGTPQLRQAREFVTFKAR
jgi:uncharacterized protein (DUF4213/DUF364 family)